MPRIPEPPRRPRNRIFCELCGFMGEDGGPLKNHDFFCRHFSTLMMSLTIFGALVYLLTHGPGAYYVRQWLAK